MTVNKGRISLILVAFVVFLTDAAAARAENRMLDRPIVVKPSTDASTKAASSYLTMVHPDGVAPGPAPGLEIEPFYTYDLGRQLKYGLSLYFNANLNNRTLVASFVPLNELDPIELQTLREKAIQGQVMIGLRTEDPGGSPRYYAVRTVPDLMDGAKLETEDNTDQFGVICRAPECSALGLDPEIDIVSWGEVHRIPPNSKWQID